MSNIELSKLDNKYTMLVYICTNGKIDCYNIVTKEVEKLYHSDKDDRRMIFKSLEDGLKHAGKNCDDVVFAIIDPIDGAIINKVYKAYGGYVTLNGIK